MKKYLGIEFGSTRIKSVLIDENAETLAVGGYDWENKLIGGVWSYEIDEVRLGMQESFRAVAADYESKFGEPLTHLDALGVSAMMHGYMAFNDKDELLVPFRTWRNTMTAEASDEITEALDSPVPQRWTASHYYQAVLNKEPHLKELSYICTLEAYVHYLLSGKRVLGVGEASGVFPVKGADYDREKLAIFNNILASHGATTPFESLVPPVMKAGEIAGYLTREGARLLDPSGKLLPGVPMCPPEGDVQTGMISTGCVRPGTGNVSAGTSAFAAIVTDKDVPRFGSLINKVSTPSGNPAVMIQINNCTCEINAWTALFREVLETFGAKVSTGELMTTLFNLSEKADESVGDLTVFNNLSGEPVLGLDEGVRLLVRPSCSNITLPNMMKSLVYSAVSSLSIGFKILEERGVKPNMLCGHGGYFKTEKIGAKAMAAALDTPITVLKNAGEGGAWGIATLALYLDNTDKSLEDFLDGIFANQPKSVEYPDDREKQTFKHYIENYKAALPVEFAAIKK